MQQSQTKITNQQKTKIFMHWILLVVAHIYVFVYVPIHSSIYMYNDFQCDRDSAYGCKDFSENVYLKCLYGLFAIYLWLSARQISLGFPIQKVSSSLFQ